MTLSSSAPGAPVCAPPSAWPRKVCHRLHHQSVSDTQPYGRRPRRHLRRARQHGRGRLALAHVRHGQGLGLARRSGCHRIMCREAIAAVIEFEHYGVPSRRTDGWQIYQRPFGGMTTNFGEGIAQRTCAAADRTGHAMLHTLYQQSMNHQSRILCRILRHRPHHGGMAMPRRCRAESRRRHAASLSRAYTSWRPAAMAVPIFPARPRIPAPVTAAAWRCAPACRCRTWSSCSSIRPASMARAA